VRTIRVTASTLRSARGPTSEVTSDRRVWDCQNARSALVFEHRGCGRRSAATRKLSIQTLSGVAVVHESKVCQRSRSIRTRHSSVVQRAFGITVTEGDALIRGRHPMPCCAPAGRINWKTRCTVFLLRRRRPTTVR
jgi:hypothetical protein